MKVWKKAAIGLGFLVVVGVLAVGYLGFMPGVSDAMGTNRPVDLGVKPTPADLDSAKRKLAELQSPSDQPVRIQLTSSEITAFVGDKIEKMDSIPLQNTQIKLRDGGLQVSGTLDMAKLSKITDQAGFSASTKAQIESLTGLVKTNPSVFVDADIKVENGLVKAEFKEMKVGQFTIPADQVAAGSKMLSESLQDTLKSGDFSVQSLQIKDGMLDIQSLMQKAP